jgi:hypothetical protein
MQALFLYRYSIKTVNLYTSKILKNSGYFDIKYFLRAIKTTVAFDIN